MKTGQRMANHDKLQRFIFENAPIRGEYIHLHDSFQTIIKQYDYPPLLRQLLGEALSVAGLLCALIKFQGRITVQFRGKGKLKLLLAQCDTHFQIRGLIKWEGDLSYAELMEAANEGVLAIMLDGESSPSHYQGIVPWHGDSLAEAIEGYFRNSEQLATKLWLNVTDTSAVGFLLQMIPESVNTAGLMEKTHLDWDRITNLTAALFPAEVTHIDYQSLLAMLYPDETLRVFPSVDVHFGCTCSYKRSAEAILLLGKEEAEDELKDKQIIVVTCDFCNKEYIFNREVVEKIFENNDISISTKLH